MIVIPTEVEAFAGSPSGRTLSSIIKRCSLAEIQAEITPSG